MLRTALPCLFRCNLTFIVSSNVAIAGDAQPLDCPWPMARLFCSAAFFSVHQIIILLTRHFFWRFIVLALRDIIFVYQYTYYRLITQQNVLHNTHSALHFFCFVLLLCHCVNINTMIFNEMESIWFRILNLIISFERQNILLTYLLFVILVSIRCDEF